MSYYTPQQWVDDDPTKPLSAARMSVLESRLLYQSMTSDGVIPIDSFGSLSDSDDTKFGLALAYSAQQTRRVPLMFPPRQFGPLTTTRTPYSGMRLVGPPGNGGVKNLEIASKALVNHHVRVETGSGTAALFNQAGDLNDVVLSQIAFDGSASSVFWNQASGQCYPIQFDSLSFNGFSSPFPALTMTQGVLSGHWTVLNYSATPLVFKGSDNSLWITGFLNSNSPASVAGAGRPIIKLDYCQKTSVGYMYITCENDWIGLQVAGTDDRDVAVFGGTYEGRSTSNPATRALIDIQGGSVVMYRPGIGFVSGSSSAAGCITQSGGYLAVQDVLYRRASGTPADFPLLYQTGGVAHVRWPRTNNGEQVRIRWSDGTTQTLPLLTNQALT